jgi:hypothetical protein
MKILLIGSKGNMGRRYAACLSYLGVDFQGIDVGEKSWSDYDRVIIASPTETHLELMEKYRSMGVPYLVEKPIRKGLFILPKKYQPSDERIVCNWHFAINHVLADNRDIMVKGETRIEYDCYNTGKDGTAWDCIQLIHLAGPKNITIKTESPVMTCRVYTERNPKGYLITSRDIEESYVAMISAWIQSPEMLWGMDEALRAHEEVIEYIHLHPEHA